MLRSPFQSPCRPAYGYPAYEHVSLPQIELFSTNTACCVQPLPPPPDAWMLAAFGGPGPENLPIENWPPQQTSSLNDTTALPKLSFEINESGRAQISSVSNETEAERTVSQEYFNDWDLSGRILDLSSSPYRHEPVVLNCIPDNIPEEFPKLNFDIQQSEPQCVDSAVPHLLPSARPALPALPILSQPVPLLSQLDENQSCGSSESVYSSSELNSDIEPFENWNRDSKPKVLKSVDQLERLVRRGVKRARASQELSSSQVSTDSGVTDNSELRPIHIDEVNGLFNGMKTRKEAIEIMQPKALRGSLRCSNECSETFDSYLGLAEHLDKHHDNTTRPYLCPVPNCPWSVLGFRFHNECKRHVTCAHTGPELRCVLCNSTFKRADALRRHLATRHLSKKIKPKRTNKKKNTRTK